MTNIVVVPFEKNPSALFSGLKEFPAEKVFLIVPHEKKELAEKTKNDLEKFQIPAEIETIKDTSFEEFFEVISHIKAKERDKTIVMNLGSIAEPMHCIALSAAFVNGIKAFEVVGNKVVKFPILKFSYYDVLAGKKLEILSLLNKSSSVDSLEHLGKKLNLGSSLINYHLYGNQKSPGLEKLGLVEVKREKGRIKVELTGLGKLLLKERKKTIKE